MCTFSPLFCRARSTLGGYTASGITRTVVVAWSGEYECVGLTESTQRTAFGRGQSSSTTPPRASREQELGNCKSHSRRTDHAECRTLCPNPGGPSSTWRSLRPPAPSSPSRSRRPRLFYLPQPCLRPLQVKGSSPMPLGNGTQPFDNAGRWMWMKVRGARTHSPVRCAMSTTTSEWTGCRPGCGPLLHWVVERDERDRKRETETES